MTGEKSSELRAQGSDQLVQSSEQSSISEKTSSNNRTTSHSTLHTPHLIRLVIYLIISFGIPFLLIFIYIANFGFTVENDWYGPLASFAMFCPAIANIITRLVTKEGTENLCLKIKFKGNIRYFLIALIFPIICGIITALIASLTLFPENSLSNMFQHFRYNDFAVLILYVVSVTIAAVFMGFGEEFGWRAYMMAKLEKLMSPSAALIVGGIIWGLWHAPLVACGHNFGNDYPAYPWLGIILMCISCVCIGVYLTALTKASHSVLPAALAHIAINNMCGAISGTMLSYIDIPESELMKISSEFSYSLLFMITMSVSALAAGIAIFFAQKISVKK